MKSFKQYLGEDLRQWFKQKWVRMDTKGNIKGDCAREPGEGKPKCLPQAKAHAIGKEARASAAQRKRREDPNPERRGAPINVKTEEVNEALTRSDLSKHMVDTLKRPEKPGPNKPGTPGGAWTGPKKDDYGYTGYQGQGMPTDKQERELDRKKKDVDEACWDGYTAKGMKKKGNRMVPNCVPEEVESIDEKNVPTSPEKWARAKAAAKSKFAVYPSAYANGWASKKYKAMGGGWRTEETVSEDGAMGGSVGPTNVVGGGAIAGTGGKGGEPGIYLPRRKKSAILMDMIKRKPTK
jgi:hypothetical protein